MAQRKSIPEISTLLKVYTDVFPKDLSKMFFDSVWDIYNIDPISPKNNYPFSLYYPFGWRKRNWEYWEYTLVSDLGNEKIYNYSSFFSSSTLISLCRKLNQLRLITNKWMQIIISIERSIIKFIHSFFRLHLAFLGEKIIGFMSSLIDFLLSKDILHCHSP